MATQDDQSISGDDATQPPTLLLIADDLMFPSRVREGVKPLGYAVRVVPTADAAQTALAADPLPAVILINLTARRYDPLAVIAACKADPRTAAVPLLAFAGHVEQDKHTAARAAGADLVAANSSVALHLDALLNRLLVGHRASGIGQQEPEAAE